MLRRITLSEHAELTQHARNAIQRRGPSGWRIDAPARGICVDGILALATAGGRARAACAPALELLGQA